MTKRKDSKAPKPAPVGLDPGKTETSTTLEVQPSKAGRPSTFSLDVVDAICNRMAGGESLNAICKDEGMPAESTVRAWVLDDEGGIAAKYARARELQAEFWADDIIRLADESRIGTKIKTSAHGDEITTGDMVERTRLQIESRKWLLSKLLPKRYGDKLDLTSGGDRLPTVVINVPPMPNGEPDA